MYHNSADSHYTALGLIADVSDYISRILLFRNSGIQILCTLNFSSFCDFK